MSASRCNVSNQDLTFCRVLSALLAPIERGTLSYVIVGWSDDSVCETLTLLVASVDSEINAMTGDEVVMQLRLVRDGFIRWMNLLTWSIQSSKLSSISSWSHSCSQHLDNPFGSLWYILCPLQLLDCRCQSNIFWMPLVFDKVHKVGSPAFSCRRDSFPSGRLQDQLSIV